MRSIVIHGVLMLALAAPSALAQTVTLRLNSPQDGQNVPAGATIDWSISVEVSTGDNLGLALVATDLVQGESNPEKLEIPPGNSGSISAAMAQFSRPAGLSNPGEGGATTGFVGVQRGTTGEKNLKQIGGGQNTFGTAGAAFGQDIEVEAGIGQSGPIVVLSGSFPAPSANGTYVFRLDNALANVLTTINTAPTASNVVSATVDTLTDGSFTFQVGTAALGDMNCDNTLDLNDVSAFVLAQVDPTAYASAYPGCDPLRGDFADNDILDGRDISGFVSALLAP